MVCALLSRGMKKLGAHPLPAFASLAAYLVSNLINRDVPNHLSKLCRLVAARYATPGAADAGHLPSVVGKCLKDAQPGNWIRSGGAPILRVPQLACLVHPFAKFARRRKPTQYVLKLVPVLPIT